MGRKPVIINPLSGKRLKKLIAEQKTTQDELANALRFSKKTVNGWCTGRSSITYQNALAIHNLYPAYSVEWLLGQSEYPNALSHIDAVSASLSHESELLYSGLFAFARLGGYKINIKDMRNSTVDEYLDFIKAGIEFEKDGICFSLGFQELNDMGNDLLVLLEQWLSRRMDRAEPSLLRIISEWHKRRQMIRIEVEHEEDNN